jgi:uncharacterized protein (DUF1684 family)
MDKNLSNRLTVRLFNRVFMLIAALILAGCATTPPPEWTAWRARRNESIGGTNGWTTLVGLNWLQEGDNPAGSGSSNQVVLHGEGVPEFVGNFNRNSNSVSFTAVSNADVRIDGHVITKAELQTDDSPKPTRMQMGSLSVIAIHRGDRIGLRVRDPNSDARRHFSGLRWFPYDPHWRVAGHFVPFPQERQLRVPDVTGNTQIMTSPGSIFFDVNGAEYRLDAVQEKGEPDLFVMFHDETAGDSTYAAGRFLDVPKPDSAGRTVVDFNRAYTPPCGFTAYATCPIPPKQNWLPLAVQAGELKPEGGNH